MSGKKASSPTLSASRACTSTVVRLCWFIAFGTTCSNQSFVRNEPALRVTPFEDSSTNYANTSEIDGVVGVDLGTTDLYSIRSAKFRLHNPSGLPLIISAVRYVARIPETDWLAPKWRAQALDDVLKPFPDGSDSQITVRVGPLEAIILEVPFAPSAEPSASARLEIISDAGENPIAPVRIEARARDNGSPTLEVRYQGNAGPDAEECTLSDAGGQPFCRMNRSLNLGGVALGFSKAATITLANLGSCTEGDDLCQRCVLNIRSDPNRQGIGIGFAPPSQDSPFAFQGSTATPVLLSQSAAQDCGAPSSARLPLTFRAPLEEGDFETTVVIESNAPNQPLVEIPILAQARKAPVAIATLRAPDPEDEQAPFSLPETIEPLGEVFLDGRASFDPDGKTLNSFRWEVIDFPLDTDTQLFELQGQSTPLAQLIAPLAGRYELLLTVTNSEGVESIDTEQARVAFDAIPRDNLHVQLVWDDPDNDFDLHMTFVDRADEVCGQPYDVHWRNNQQPIWDAAHPPDSGPNPSLDRDDTDGRGPENINVAEPGPGRYRLYAHYFADRGANPDATRATLRVWLNGLQVAELSRRLDERELWAAMDVLWDDRGVGSVQVIPPDSEGELGAITTMWPCDPSAPFVFEGLP